MDFDEGLNLIMDGQTLWVIQASCCQLNLEKGQQDSIQIWTLGQYHHHHHHHLLQLHLHYKKNRHLQKNLHQNEGPNFQIRIILSLV